MMKPLRKRHLQIWTVSAFLLPAGIILAWLAIPNYQPVKLLQSAALPLLPVIKHTKNVDEYTVNIRTSNDHSVWQLEWKNNLPLVVPSAVIYRTNHVMPGTPFNPGSAELLGRIESNSTYIFALPENPSVDQSLHFVLYDFIHEKTIDTINFQP
jgi:hypothetical protein